jgi:hypothetical protein
MHTSKRSFRSLLCQTLVTVIGATTAVTSSADGSYAVYDMDEVFVGQHIAPDLVQLTLGSTKYAVSMEARQADRKVIAFHIYDLVFEGLHCSGEPYVQETDLPNTLSPRAVVLRKHGRTLVYPTGDLITRIDPQSRLTPDGVCSRLNLRHLRVSALAESTDITDMYRRPFHIK